MSQMKNCAMCSTPFPKDGTRRSVCSPECFIVRRLKYSEKYFPRKSKEKICSWCKSYFLNERIGNVKYCSPTCSLEAFAFGNKKWRMKNVVCKRIPGKKKFVEKSQEKAEQIRGKKMHIQQLELPISA